MTTNERKAHARRIKKSILKCLTEDFTYGKGKRKKTNQAIFSLAGWQCFNGTNLDMVMDKVVLGIWFTLEEQSK